MTMPKRASPGRQEAPWYRQAGFWWLMAPPFAAVVGGMITLKVAIDHPDQLLSGDPAGSAIPQVLIQEAQAHSKHITATLEQKGGYLQITLRGQHERPEILLIQLQPWGSRDQPQHLSLHASSPGIYRAIMPAALASGGNWYVELAPADGKWLLTGPLRLGLGEQPVVMGAMPSMP